MQKQIFNQIVVDNIDSTLVSVTLSNGLRIGRELVIEGNRTTTTTVTFIKIEDTYVAVRKHTEVTYDYNGQISKGDTRNADFYMGYDEVVALEFYDELSKPLYASEESVEEQPKEKHEIIKKPGRESGVQDRKNPEDDLFIKTAGDI